jgi:hypothetical protein
VPDFTFFPASATKKQIAKTFGFSIDPPRRSLTINLRTTADERSGCEEMMLSNRFDEIPLWENTL